MSLHLQNIECNMSRSKSFLTYEIKNDKFFFLKNKFLDDENNKSLCIVKTIFLTRTRMSLMEFISCKYRFTRSHNGDEV
jgi:hypothetical protein